MAERNTGGTMSGIRSAGPPPAPAPAPSPAPAPRRPAPAPVARRSAPAPAPVVRRPAPALMPPPAQAPTEAPTQALRQAPISRGGLTDQTAMGIPIRSLPDAGPTATAAIRPSPPPDPTSTALMRPSPPADAGPVMPINPAFQNATPGYAKGGSVRSDSKPRYRSPSHKGRK
jgi:hypothetical protein